MNSEEIKIESKKKILKKEYKLGIFFYLILLLLISVVVISSQYFIKENTSIIVFLLILNIPLLFTHTNFLLDLLPNNLTNLIVKSVKTLELEVTDNIELTRNEIMGITNKKMEEYFKLFIVLILLGLSSYYLYKQKKEVTDITKFSIDLPSIKLRNYKFILFSMSLSILSNIIISNFF